MTHSDPEEPLEPTQQPSGYFLRDVDQFHREANVFAGHDPQGVSADPPKNLRTRRIMVFTVLTITCLLAAGIAVGLMSVPQCENPQYNWLPCLPDF